MTTQTQTQTMHPHLPRLAKHKLDNEANRGVPRLLRLLAHVNLLEYLDTQAPQYEQPPRYEQSELEDLVALLKERMENKTAGVPMQIESAVSEDDLLSKLGPEHVLHGFEEMLPAYQPPTAITVAEVEVEDDD